MNQEKKILLITLEYPPFYGGISRYYANLVFNWNWEIDVLSKGLLTKFIWPKWLPAVWEIWRKIKKGGVGIIWVGHVLPLGYPALFFWRYFKIPYAVFIHGMDILIPQSSYWKKKWLKKILNGAKFIAANSEFTKEEIKKLGISEKKIIIVRPCPADNFFVADTKEEIIEFKYNEGVVDNKIILSVGRLTRRKGFDKVIKVLLKILKRAPDAKYVIVGSGADKLYLESLVSLLDLKNAVIFKEGVSDKNLKKWYQAANLFVMPCERFGTDVEGFGSVFLEAAGFGLPVVVGNSGGAGEAVKNGYNGYLVNPTSEEEIYQTILKLLIDENFARRMGEYGKKWVMDNFRWDKEILKLRALNN